MHLWEGHGLTQNLMCRRGGGRGTLALLAGGHHQKTKCAGPRLLSPSLVPAASEPRDHGNTAKFDLGGLQSINTGPRINVRLLSVESTGRRAQSNDTVLWRCLVAFPHHPLITVTRAYFWARGLAPAIKERLYPLAPLVP